MNQAAILKIPEALDFRVLSRYGDTRWIGHLCVDIVDERGEYQGLRVSNRDITELKQAEAEVLADQAVLSDKNAALKEVLAHIESEKSRIKDQIAANKDRVILPLLTGLRHKVGKENLATIDKVVKALEEITSPFANELSRRFATLSPREVEVCAMIRERHAIQGNRRLSRSVNPDRTQIPAENPAEAGHH